MQVNGDIISSLCLFSFAGLLIAAAVSDARNLIIPNRITGGIALLYPAYVLSLAGSIDRVDWPMAVAIAAGVLIFGAIMFGFGFMGGGDAKLFAATALWAGPGLVIPFLFFTFVVGGIVSFVVLMRVRFGWVVGMSDDMSESVPYGIAIATGGLVVAHSLYFV